MRITKNPDSYFVKAKLKEIKSNNGYCPGCPKTKDYKCMCKKFIEMDYSGWCDEAVYYKDVEAE